MRKRETERERGRGNRRQMHCEKDVKEGGEGRGWRGVAEGRMRSMYNNYDTTVKGGRGGLPYPLKRGYKDFEGRR